MSDEYARLSVHRWMLGDEVRNEAYRDAIAKVVRPGDRVLDMGAGSGILSIFAAQSGASKVFAVERTSIADVAREMIAQNGVADRVEVLRGDLEDVELPGPVDVIISEWMGGMGIDENMLAPLVIARDRWLSEGGTIIPARVTAFLAPMWVPEIAQELSHWRSRPHGVDFGPIAERTANETVMAQFPVTTDDLLAAPQAMWSHDAHTCTLATADASFAATCTFVAARSGRLSALAAWFDAELCEGVHLTNAVGQPDTHWGRFFLPLSRTIDVREGDTIEAHVRLDPAAQGGCETYWTVRVAGGAVEEHDTRPVRSAAFR
jgi:protein arginine N-methyltransferase 1